MWIYVASLATTALALLELAKDWREHSTNLRRVAVMGLIVVAGIAGALATYFTDQAAEKRHNEDEEHISKLEAKLNAEDLKLDQIVLLLHGRVEQPTPSSPPFVSLSWQPSPSPNAIGYFVYRSSSQDPHGNLRHMTRLNDEPIRTTSFVDPNVQPGHSYFYVVTAADAQGHQSRPSAEIIKIIKARPPYTDSP